VDVEGAVLRAAQLSATGFDAYMACAEFEYAHNRRAENVIGAWALWLDVDIGKPKAEDRKGYEEIWQARAALRDFLARTVSPPDEYSPFPPVEYSPV